MEQFIWLDHTSMRRISVLFTCCLDEKTINSVWSLFNFSLLPFIQILMSSIQASIEDEISSHLSCHVHLCITGIAMIFNIMPFKFSPTRLVYMHLFFGPKMDPGNTPKWRLTSGDVLSASERNWVLLTSYIYLMDPSSRASTISLFTFNGAISVEWPLR